MYDEKVEITLPSTGGNKLQARRVNCTRGHNYASGQIVANVTPFPFYHGAETDNVGNVTMRREVGRLDKGTFKMYH